MFVKKYDWSHKYETCIECGSTKAKYHSNGLCATCYCRDLKKRNPIYKSNSLARTREWNKKIRLVVLQAYSALEPFCACCNERTLAFLAIDHINNDGTEHRKLTKGSGSKTYIWIYRNKYPKGFQVLCHNCNMAKSLYGICPHQKP